MITVRAATADDLPAIRRVGERTWPPTYGFAGDDYVADGLQRWWSPEALERMLRDTTALVAVSGDNSDDSADDEVLGVANLDTRTDPPTMWKLYVLPSQHGRGVGSTLLRAVIAALPPGSTGLQLDVMDGNTPAQDFYRRRGFVETGVVQPPDRDGWPATIWMQLTL